jgi:hypothetical protein
MRRPSSRISVACVLVSALLVLFWCGALRAHGLAPSDSTKVQPPEPSNANSSAASDRNTGKKSHIAANLFILGAQKAGTSSLFLMMKKHNKICSGHKEPHFFHYDHEYSKGPEFYGKYFVADASQFHKCGLAHPLRGSSIKPGHYFMDGSTVLHDMFQAAPRIKEFYGESASSLKFIVILREPVSRDYSCYQHYGRNTVAHVPSRFPQYAIPFAPFVRHQGILTMSELLSHNLTVKMRYQSTNVTPPYDSGNVDFIRGEYVHQLKGFLKYFHRSQLMILNSDYIIANHVTVMNAIAEFLGLKSNDGRWHGPYPHSDHSVGSKCVHEHVPPVDCSFRDVLAKYYDPLNYQLMQLLNDTKSEAPPMEPPFPPFGDSYQGVICVKDARATLNEILKSGSSDKC